MGPRMTSAVWNTVGPGRDPDKAGQAVGIGLWVFIGVATALFTLFLLANLMRMTAQDWWPLTLPWQLWLSSALLVAGSVALQRAAGHARGGRGAAARLWLRAGGACAFGFLVSQLWAWSALQAVGVFPSGNPAASFFYLLTALHGLHVAGGLVGWLVTARAVSAARDAATDAWRIVLCARYWHFLLAVWIALFAAMGWLTPDIARFICAPLRLA
jgi:cytochrome c oxidase subunit 3